MKRVLVTGMSGVGKSALLEELAARGYRTVDTDYGDYYETADGEQLWRRDRIEELLRTAGTAGATGTVGSAETVGNAETPGPEGRNVLFIQGTTRNQGSFYPWFNHIVLLSAPVEVLIQRLTTRTTNSYGKDPAELAETLEYVQTVEPLLRASATIEVVTTVPVPTVADIVLAHVL
jgi:GTPase SAR1 family protein